MWNSNHEGGVAGHSGLFGRGARYRYDHNRIFQCFQVSSSWSTAYKTGGLGLGFDGSHLCNGTPFRSYTKCKTTWANIQGSQINLVVPQGRVLGPLKFLVYVNDIWRNIDWSVRLFAENCIIYRKTSNKATQKSCRKIWTHWRMGGGKWDENNSPLK